MNIRKRGPVMLTGLAGSAVLATLALLAGCPSQSNDQTSAPEPTARSAAFGGTIFGGRQPIVGATVVAYAAGTMPGDAPREIGHTSTDSSGHFTMTFSPAPTAGQVVYVVAKNGISVTGGGVNTATRLLTVAGIQDSTLAPVPATVNIDELTTVAAAALKDYIQFVDCATITGNTQAGTCVAVPGALDLQNMAATAGNLVNVVNGQASDFLTTNAATAGAPLTATLEKLDTLANVLAACVNAPGPTDTACSQLFRAALANPTNTLKAAWLIAEAPAVNQRAEAIYALSGSAPVIYASVLAAAPASAIVVGFWTVGGERYVYIGNNEDITISIFRLGREGGTLAANGPAVDAEIKPRSVAVDPTGRFVYVPNNADNTVSGYAINSDGTLAPIGTPVPTGDFPYSIAIGP